RRDRRDRLAASHRRPADRRLPRSGLPELAEEAARGCGGVMLRALVTALALVFAVGAAAQPELARKSAAKPAAKAAKPKPNVRPAWAELTAEQQQILAPLKADWDLLDPERRLKWIAIAKRYPRMKAMEQERVQRRMQAWARLTPEQRRQARENYKQLAKTQRPAPH